jgi:hypothetical protein
MTNITSANSSKVKPGEADRFACEGGRVTHANLEDTAIVSDDKAGGIFFQD